MMRDPDIIVLLVFVWTAVGLFVLPLLYTELESYVIEDTDYLILVMFCAFFIPATVVLTFVLGARHLGHKAGKIMQQVITHNRKKMHARRIEAETVTA